jgi:hypothetical protein
MEIAGSTILYIYHCYEGYSILNPSTLSCTNGTLLGEAPVCTGVDPPRIDYFYPDEVIKSTLGDTVEIISITTGTQPLSVTWYHNGSRVVNDTTVNDTHFSLTEIIYSEMLFSKLTISNVGEGAQGVYKIVANNVGGRAESGEAQLMLAVDPPRIDYFLP